MPLAPAWQREVQTATSEIMSLEITIDIDDRASPAVRKLMSAISPEGMKGINAVAAREELEHLREYHREFEGAGGWENPALPTHGPGRKETGFGQNIARAWLTGEVSADGFTMTNNATGLAHKVRGGTISAKTAKALTIPMVPEAHGVRARDYPNRLFIPKGKDYLMEIAGGVPRVVYLLRQSVTQKPWDGALPDAEEIGSRVAQSIARLVLEEVDT